MQINCNVKPQGLENVKGSVHSFVYQNLVYKKLGLRWLKNKFYHKSPEEILVYWKSKKLEEEWSVSIDKHVLLSLLLLLLLLSLLLILLYYYDYVYLGLVGSSGMFPRCIQQPQVSKTCLTIFAVPSNAAFRKNSMLLFMSNFLTQSN